MKEVDTAFALVHCCYFTGRIDPSLKDLRVSCVFYTRNTQVQESKTGQQVLGPGGLLSAAVKAAGHVSQAHSPLTLDLCSFAHDFGS